MSYLPAYLPAVPHVGHQRLIGGFGRLGNRNPRGVLPGEKEQNIKGQLEISEEMQQYDCVCVYVCGGGPQQWSTMSKGSECTAEKWRRVLRGSTTKMVI